MTHSFILQQAARPVLVLTMLVSLYLLIRGHNEPGGGFVGGLVAAAGLVFYAVSQGRDRALNLMRLGPLAWCATGLLLAMASGFLAWLDPAAGFLTHRWWFPDVGFYLPLGTALVFDVGVYLTVIGTVTALFFALMED